MFLIFRVWDGVRVGSVVTELARGRSDTDALSSYARSGLISPGRYFVAGFAEDGRAWSGYHDVRRSEATFTKLTEEEVLA